MKRFLLSTLAFLLCASAALADEYFSESVSNTPIAVKATGGQVHGWNITNPNSVPVYLHFYNAVTGSVTVGTTAQATAPIAIPATGAFFVRNSSPPQNVFTAAITIAATTSPLSSVSTAPASPIVVSILFQ